MDAGIVEVHIALASVSLQSVPIVEVIIAVASVSTGVPIAEVPIVGASVNITIVPFVTATRVYASPRLIVQVCRVERHTSMIVTGVWAETQEKNPVIVQV